MGLRLGGELHGHDSLAGHDDPVVDRVEQLGLLLPEIGHAPCARERP